jgi:hypothetical protein
VYCQVFTQRYKTELTPEQLASITAIINRHKHPLISKEIKRELASVKRMSHIRKSQISILCDASDLHMVGCA